MEKSCMIPARYCTIFKTQKQNSITMKKKSNLFFIAHSTSLTIFFFNQRVLSSPSFSAKLDTCLPLKLINKEHKMEKKMFYKCYFLSVNIFLNNKIEFLDPKNLQFLWNWCVWLVPVWFFFQTGNIILCCVIPLIDIIN